MPPRGTTGKSSSGATGGSKTASTSSGSMRSGPGATGGSKTASTSSGSMRSGPGATGGSKTANRSTSSNSAGSGGGLFSGGYTAPKSAQRPSPPKPTPKPARRPTPAPDDFTGFRFGNPASDVIDARKTPKLSTSPADRARAAAFKMEMLGNTIGDAFDTNKKFLSETSRLTPNVQLPSRKSSAFGQIYKGGGLVTKKGRVPPKGKK